MFQNCLFSVNWFWLPEIPTWFLLENAEIIPFIRLCIYYKNYYFLHNLSSGILEGRKKLHETSSRDEYNLDVVQEKINVISTQRRSTA